MVHSLWHELAENVIAGSESAYAWTGLLDDTGAIEAQHHWEFGRPKLLVRAVAGPLVHGVDAGRV